MGATPLRPAPAREGHPQPPVPARLLGPHPGAVAASDAFFPFADGLQILLAAGVRTVVASGGSVRDAEVIAAAEATGVKMYFTGTQHFAP